MNSDFVPVTHDRFFGKGWRRHNSFAKLAGETYVPVVFAELDWLLPAYPLAFLKGEDNAFRLVALLSLVGNSNLFLTEENDWRGGYIPALFRAFPFGVQKMADEEGEVRPVLAFDLSSNLLVNEL